MKLRIVQKCLTQIVYLSSHVFFLHSTYALPNPSILRLFQKSNDHQVTVSAYVAICK